jgi:hypothetical protein
MRGFTVSFDKADKVDPLSNDDWFERHVEDKIENLEIKESGYYSIDISLCYKRHLFVDEFGGRVDFSVFPMIVEVPQKWTSNYGHAIRFLRTLKAKIDSFNQPGAIIDIRLYISGASGCFKAFEYAYYNKQAKQGFEHFDAPESWMCKYMIWNNNIQTYEEESAIYER